MDWKRAERKLKILSMRMSDKTEPVYELFPRFVECGKEQPFLPRVERQFERNGILFDFIIMPASVLMEENKNEYFYPGEVEELVEKALRTLAVTQNPNFSEEEHILSFSLTQLMLVLEKNTGKDILDKDQIELSLNILCNVEYQLANDGRVMIFRPINGLLTQKKNSEIYYKVRFLPIFFNNVQMLNLCFGKEKRLF